MGGLSLWHWIIVLIVVLVLFGGGGKLSRLMGDAARGINAFKKGLKEDEEGSTSASGETKVLREGTGETVSDQSKKDEAAKS